ncbi:MAG: hypothetical protein KGH60_05065 [Candidatus Micrarchaeota archaeon]|nr:hypothetical protein [Candidatus Micrarchaeota archaeon]
MEASKNEEIIVTKDWKPIKIRKSYYKGFYYDDGFAWFRHSPELRGGHIFVKDTNGERFEWCADTVYTVLQELSVLNPNNPQLLGFDVWVVDGKELMRG